MASSRDHTLDGLRAVAVTLVVLHHTLTQPVADALTRHGLVPVGRLVSSTTASGVELFFVLSGILLLGPFTGRGDLADRPTPTFASRRYVQRRIERIWPPYLLALVLAASVIAFATARPTWYTRSVLPRFSVVGLVRQLGIVNFGWTSYNGAWWSLTIELVFYLTLPAAIVVLIRRSRPPSPAVTAIMTSIVIVAALVAFPVRQAGANPTLPGQLVVFVMYLPCFVLGGFVAAGGPSRRVIIAMAASGTIILGTSLVATSVSPIPAYALLYTALIAGVSRPRLRPLSMAMREPSVVWVGERSYSMFLVHFSVLYFLLHCMSFVFPSRTVAYFVLTRVLALPAILLTTVGVFELAEKPFARGLVTAQARWPWQAARTLPTRLALDPN